MRSELAPQQGQTRETGPQVVAIGDVAIVGAPAEYFTGLGVDIKKRSPFKHTVVAELGKLTGSDTCPIERDISWAAIRPGWDSTATPKKALVNVSPTRSSPCSANSRNECKASPAGTRSRPHEPNGALWI